jgi:hypothetical protein
MLKLKLQLVLHKEKQKSNWIGSSRKKFIVACFDWISTGKALLFVSKNTKTKNPKTKTAIKPRLESVLLPFVSYKKRVPISTCMM